MEGTNNDVMIVDSTSNDLLVDCLNQHSDKPLMMLFKRLISNKTKENTVLTNAQIIDILQREFNKDILYGHELEIEIYLNILKKFLKDWPQWDEFDSTVNTLKSEQDTDIIKKLLEVKYIGLKEYLRQTLKSVEPLLRKTMEEVKQATVKTDNIDDDEIVMQLQCTRQQLNHLIFRRPHSNFNNSIFNVGSNEPSKIRINTFHIVQMLNWPGVRINFNVNGTLIFRREMCFNLKHVLINKKLNYVKRSPEILKTNFQMRGAKQSAIDVAVFIGVLDDIYEASYTHDDMRLVLQAICDLIKSDLEDGPRILEFPATYRKTLTKSPFRRYLYEEVDTMTPSDGNNYDLQLEETAVPQCHLHFSKIQRENEIASSGAFLNIECTFCECKFDDCGILEEMKHHFQVFHQGEPYWHCMSCKQMFTMEDLTMIKYVHTCEPKDSDDE